MKSFLLTTALLAATGAWALNPVREYANTPESMGMNYKEHKVTTPDGATLEVWFFEAPKSKEAKKTIIISDDGEGNMSDNLELVSQFTSLGYNVVAYDYRGYGKSSDFTIDKNMLIYPQFAVDLNAVMDYTKRNFNLVFNMYGIGIGGALSIGLGNNRPEALKIIADAPFSSLEKTQKDLKSKYEKEIKIPFGFNKNYEPIYALEKQNSRVKGILIIVAEKDDLIGPAQAKELKAKNSSVEILIIKGGQFNKDNFTSDKNGYFQSIGKFLNDK